jgi:hypothetical protein
LWLASRQFMGLAFVFLITPVVIHYITQVYMTAPFGIIQLLCVPLFFGIKYLHEIKGQPAPSESYGSNGSASNGSHGKATFRTLPMGLSFPFIASRSIEGLFYALLTGAFTNYTFKGGIFMNLLSIGAFLIGGGGTALLIALSRLKRKRNVITPSDQARRSSFLDIISPKTWMLLMVLSAGVMMLGGVLALPTVYLISTGLVGALTSITYGQWMSLFQKELSPAELSKATPKLHNWGMLATFVPVLLVGLAKGIGLAVLPILSGVTIAIFTGLLLAWLFTKNPGAFFTKNLNSQEAQR